MSPRRLFPLVVLALSLSLAPGLASPARAAETYKDIEALWPKVEPPAAPELKDVAVAPATTALLILDIEEATCNAERRPRCLETVPRIADLMHRARTAGAPVIYSLTRRGTPETVLPPVKALPGQPFVQASVDKFLGTALETILKERGVTTVIVTGTAAHGAVLHTATGAAQRGLSIVLPVDGISAETPYIEQASVWLLLEGPATRGKVTPTRADRITFK